MPLMMKRATFPAAGWLAVMAVLAAAAFILWQELRPPARILPAPQRAVAVRAEMLAGTGAVIGPFRLAGALALESDDAGFGGLSGLAGLPDGQLLAISDAGQWLRLRPVLRAARLRGVAGAAMGAIAVPAGDKTDLDAEAIAFTPDGRTLVSFEQRHRIAAFAGVGLPLRPAGVLYRTLALDWPPNGGGETLAVLPDGGWLWLSEAARASGDARRALLIDASGRARQIAVPGLAGFAPTDAAVLPDGRLLLLHRLFNGVGNAAAITLVDLAPVRAGDGVARARLLARWGRDGPWPVDNMEGLALANEAGKPVLYLVSDDNFSAVQRTILLRLEIVAPLG